MSRHSDPFKPGQPLLASDLEWIRQMILKDLRVVPPLQMSETAAGRFISYAGDNSNVKRAILKEELESPEGFHEHKTAQAYLLQFTEGDLGMEVPEENPTEIEIVNREPGVSFRKGTLIYVTKVMSEYVILWASCQVYEDELPEEDQD